MLTALKKSQKVGIFTHIRPDGDAIGSSLAWKRIISANTECLVNVYCPDTIPAKYRFLPGVEAFRQTVEDSTEHDLIFVLDCSDLERLDYFKESVQASNKIVNIDHHTTNVQFGHYNLIRTSAAATAEILFSLCKEYDLHVDKEAAVCLFTAISSDTGSFKYDNTTPNTLRISADLLEKDVKPSLISGKLFDERPYSTMVLLGEALKSLTRDPTQKIAWMHIDDEQIEKSGAKPAELDGFVNYLRDIEGVEVGIFFYHSNKGHTKVGFRSKSLDVSRIAYSFGGGGHPRAAGCTVERPPLEAIKKVIGTVHGAMEELTARNNAPQKDR